MATQDIFLKKLRDVLGRTSGSITDLEYQFYLEQLGKDRGCISDLILEYLKQKTGSSFKTVADIEREWFYEGNTFDELYSGLIGFLYQFDGTATTDVDGTRYLVNAGSGEDVLLQTANGIDAGGGVTITLPSSQYVYAVYAIDMTNGNQVEKIVNGIVDSITLTHDNPINSISVVGG
jgi:hypothetical protein